MRLDDLRKRWETTGLNSAEWKEFKELENKDRRTRPEILGIYQEKSDEIKRRLPKVRSKKGKLEATPVRPLSRKVGKKRKARP